MELPRRALDGPDDYPPQPKRAQVTRRNQVVADRVLDALTTIWRDTGLSTGAAGRGAAAR